VSVGGLTLFDVFESWRAGERAAVVTQSPTRDDTVCPDGGG
jgi:hypothetical protein